MKRAVAGILWTVAAGTYLLAQAPALKSGHSKGADPFLSGAPFTLDQVIRLAEQDAIPLRRRKEAIQNRGVDFSLSTEALNKLKASGTAEELIEAIKAKARPGGTATLSKPAPAAGAITGHHFTNQQIFAEIEAILQ